MKLRSAVAAGPGYQFYDSDGLRRSLEAGPGYTDENFITQAASSYAGFDASGNLIINAGTDVRLPIMAGVSATGQYYIGWDRSPPGDAPTTLMNPTRFGVGYDW
jgi:hypothetical protein